MPQSPAERARITALVERDRLAGEIGRLDGRTRGPGDGAAVADIDAIRARADAVLGLWGERAIDPIAWERVGEYRQRLLKTVQKHSPKFRDKDFSRTHGFALEFAEEQVYADATAAVYDPETVPPGKMRAVQSRDEAGRLVTRWVGNDAKWMELFSSPARDLPHQSQIFKVAT